MAKWSKIGDINSGKKKNIMEVIDERNENLEENVKRLKEDLDEA